MKAFELNKLICGTQQEIIILHESMATWGEVGAAGDNVHTNTHKILVVGLNGDGTDGGPLVLLDICLPSFFKLCHQ